MIVIGWTNPASTTHFWKLSEHTGWKLLKSMFIWMPKTGCVICWTLLYPTKDEDFTIYCFCFFVARNSRCHRSELDGWKPFMDFDRSKPISNHTHPIPRLFRYRYHSTHGGYFHFSIRLRQPNAAQPHLEFGEQYRSLGALPIWIGQ